MKIERVGIVGCGLMGCGIAQVCAQHGYQTLISDIDTVQLNKGLEIIKTSLDSSVRKGRIARYGDETILNRLKGTTALKGFEDCDLVIECITEKMDEKKKLLTSLDEICRVDTIMASNTSCLSITEMAMATKRPDKVIGMHFFNPVPAMTLLEIVTTILSSEETFEAVKGVAESLGKSVIVAKDEPGFIVNRLLGPFLLDAMRLLEKGLATKEDIDASMVLGCNHPMGPLRLADLIGLDNLCFISEAMYKEFKDHKFEPPTILRNMVTAGHLGRKSGRGFYDYR